MLQETTSLVVHVVGSIDRLLRYETRQLGLRWLALRVLADLILLGKLSQKDLVEIEQVKQATMSTLIKDLKESGHIRTATDGKDKRRQVIQITPKGRKFANSGGARVSAPIREMLASLPADELESIRKGCLSLAECLNKDMET